MENVEDFPAPGRLERGADPAPAEDSRVRVRRRSRRSREDLRSEVEQLRVQRRILVLSVVALSGALVVLAVWGSSAQREADVLVADLRLSERVVYRLRDEFARTNAALEDSRRDLEALVADRIPGLVPFVPDHLHDVGVPLVRYVSFETTPLGLESKLVVENDGDGAVRPAFDVAVFDRVGTELARTTVLDGTHSLRPGEIRSFFADLALAAGDEAHYFRVSSPAAPHEGFAGIASE